VRVSSTEEITKELVLCRECHCFDLSMSSSFSSRLVLLTVVSASIGVAWFLHKRTRVKCNEEELDDDDDLTVLDIPIANISLFLQRDKSNENDHLKECKKVATALHEYGVILVKDDRVSVKDNDAFLDMMERLVVTEFCNIFLVVSCVVFHSR
jgi:hypothetical protein